MMPKLQSRKKAGRRAFEANILDGLTDAQKKVMKSEADAKVEVAEINKRYGAWAYVIPDYKAKDYMTEAATLLIKDEDTK